MAAPIRDQEQRELIATLLDRNVMVLAGAGAGKTTALVNRLVNGVQRGVVDVGRMAAITFTRKAAGEMRGRFLLELREARRQAQGEEAARLDDALAKIDQCFIGTIHSFCGRLLRERPVEAGLPPDFDEVDDREATVLRRDAWDRFIQRCYAREDDRLDRLDDLGLHTEDLFAFYERRSDFSDVPLKPTHTEQPDVLPAVERAMAFVAEVEAHVPAPLPVRRDGLMKMLALARHFYDNHGVREARDGVELLTILDATPEVTLKCWAPQQDYARWLKNEGYTAFVDAVVAPVLSAWRQHAYRVAASVVDDAVAFYEGERLRRGQLTFQDLLLQAARLLQGDAGVRGYFQRRYRHLFVDEFQDTDPVQAEVVMYLSGTDLDEKDWRRLVPRPGSLFLVGDEKQSIYRFRRADVQTFRFVLNRIEETGGHVVHLNTSFRSSGNLCKWINGAFPARFKQHDPAYQAGFSPLFEHHPPGADAVAVRVIETEKVFRNSRAEIVVLEAEQIAAFVAAALAGETDLNSPADDAVLPSKASPGDFMILTRGKKHLPGFARALEARGIPFDLVGGKLGERAEVKTLVEMLEAVYRPHDPLPLFAYLRGPLVGLGDDELYAFHQAGGVFSYREAVPGALGADLSQRLTDAFDRLVQARRWLEALPPAAAIEQILEALGYVPYVAMQPLGSSKAGNLLRVVSMVRAWSAKGWHWGRIVEELVDLTTDEAYKADEATLDAGRDDVVRLMNLHQAKGLQARVVILADAYDTRTGRAGPDFHVSRHGPHPFLSMPVRRPKGPFHTEVLAEPEGWEEDAAEEERFLAAEELRLRYVAATRAARLLVVCRYMGNADKGTWADLYPGLEDVPVLPRYAPVPAVPSGMPMPDVEALGAVRLQRWRAASAPTYRVGSVTGEVHHGDLREGVEGRGRDFGSFIHRLFEEAVDGRLPADEQAYLTALAAAFDLDEDAARSGGRALGHLRRSRLWRALATSNQKHTEVHFAAPVDEGAVPGVLHGIIDLVYCTGDGWHVVDYKTDAADTDAAVQAVVGRYRGQVEAYASWWERITGEPVVDATIYLHRDDEPLLLPI